MDPRQVHQPREPLNDLVLRRGFYAVREATAAGDVARAQALRGLAFHGSEHRPDRDAFDGRCRHVLIENRSGRLVAVFRYMMIEDSAAVGTSYSAQFYDLSRLKAFGGPLLELGRFCIRPGHTDPDILRLAWGAITALVDRYGARLLFGCSSFAGTDPDRYAPAFAHLGARHCAPALWRIGRRSGEALPFPPDAAESRAAMRLIPPLLRTYLSMGGWVSDHAVVDRHMNTLHVFTAVETATVPPARARSLRAIASHA